MQTTTSLRHRHPRARNDIRFSIGVGMLLMALFLCVPSVNAGTITTYTYTGNDFTYAQAPYTTSDSVTGSFTIATLAPNLVNQSIVPLSYSFSDGVQTLTNSNSVLGVVDIWTNASGAITGWGIGPTGSLGSTVSTAYAPGVFATEDVGAYPPGSLASADNTNDQGAWTSVTSATPEPSSLALMSTALLVLAFVARKRGAPGIRPSPRMPR
jgi:hypothetical protein